MNSNDDTEREGTIKVWWVPQIPMDPFEVIAPDIETAKLIVDVLADYDQFQFDNNIKPDYCNAGGIVQMEDGEWIDVEEDEE